MNTYLQIALGLLPAVLVLIISLIASRKNLKGNVPLIFKFVSGFVVFTAAIATLLVFGVKDFQKGDELELVEKNYIQAIYHISQTEEKNSISLAREMLDEQYEKATYNDELVLCNARISALEGDYRKSYMLYQKIKNKKDLDDEIKNAEALFLKSGGDKDLVSDKIEKELEKCDENILEASEIIALTNVQFLAADGPDMHTVSDISDRIDALMESHPELFTWEDLRMSRLRVNLMLGDYEKIAASVTDDSTVDEMIVATELHMGGHIDNEDYSEEYSGGYNDKRDEIKKVLQNISNNAELTPAQKLEIDKTISNYEVLEKYDSIGHNLTILSEFANDTLSPDKSKAYFEMSKIEYFLDEEDLSEDYFDAAVSSIETCTDDSFSAPMYNIANLILEDDNPENLKNTENYIIQANSAVAPLLNHQSVDATVSGVDTESMIGDDNHVDANNEKDNKKESFVEYYKDYVSLKNASLNITTINADKFETVQAVFNIDSEYDFKAEDLKKYLEVYDCGEKITDFTIKKKTYSGINVILCCDVSGSMSGNPIADLKSSVLEFIESSTSVENIGIVAFDSGIRESDTYTLGTPKSILKEGAQKLYASGGTNMYEATIEAVNMMPKSNNTINFVILLSDGIDNYRVDESEIYANIQGIAQKSGTTVYTFGLGSSVDSEYLSAFSDATGGKYLYIKDSETLGQFYQVLRNQVRNQYEITYKAIDTMTVSDRELRLRIETDALCTDTRYYDLAEEDQNATDADVAVSVNGFDKRLIKDLKKDAEINLKGVGFKETDSVNIKLKGNTTVYIDNIEFVDANTFKFVLPKGTPCSTYDAYITINGKHKILRKELTVALSNSEKVTKVGAYEFVSYEKRVDPSNDTTVLSGYVMMNDWLGFDGTVTLVGVESDGPVTMSTSSDAYILYNTKGSSGQAALYAKQGKRTSIPAFSNLKLYKDIVHDYTEDPNETNFTVDEIPLEGVISFPSLMTIASPTMSLYPDKIYIDADGISTKLPFQDTLINLAQHSQGEEMWNFSIDESITLNATQISCKFAGEVEFKEMGERTTKMGKIGNFIDLGIDTTSGLTWEFDTGKGEYEVGFSVNFPGLLNLGKKKDPGDLGVELVIGWKNNLEKQTTALNKFKVGADFDLDTVISGVPVTFSKFNIEANGFAEKIWETQLVLGCNAAIKLQKMDALEKYFGEMSLVTLDKATASIKLSEFNLKLATSVKILAFKIAESVYIEVGKMSYTNTLLGFGAADAYGVRAGVDDLGIKIDIKAVKLEATADVELALLSKFIGIDCSGVFEVALDLWIIDKDLVDANGQFVIGFVPGGNGSDIESSAFVIKTCGSTNHKQGGIYAYLYIDGKGLKTGKLK